MCARAWVEVPRDYGWGPTRLLAMDLKRAGYFVTEFRFVCLIYLALTGQRPDRAAEQSLRSAPGAR